MKTIQVTDEFWRRLKMVAASRGVSLRVVLGEIADRFLVEHMTPAEAAGVARVDRQAFAIMSKEAELRRIARETGKDPSLVRLTDAEVRELVVELEEE